MTTLSTHILDLSSGTPASGVTVRLEYWQNPGWEILGRGQTDVHGRLTGLTSQPLTEGRYRLVAETGAWFAQRDLATLFPCAQIDFALGAQPDPHYHLPFLIAPGGWSTYRGS